MWAVPTLLDEMLDDDQLLVNTTQLLITIRIDSLNDDYAKLLFKWLFGATWHEAALFF